MENRKIPVSKLHAFKSRLYTSTERIVKWTSLERTELRSALIDELEDAYAWILGSIDEPPFETFLEEQYYGNHMCTCCEWNLDKSGAENYRHCPGCGRAIKREGGE